MFGPPSNSERFAILKELVMGIVFLLLLVILTPIFPLIGFVSLFLFILAVLFIDSIDAITIVKFLDFIAFCIANWVIYLIFEQFLSIEQKWFYIFLFIISIVIVKIEWVLIFIRKISTPAPQTSIGFPKVKFSKGIVLKFIPIAIKQLFFNSIYALFPVFLVWLGFSMLSFLIHVISIPAIMDPQYADPFVIITAISISLGIFQYYLKRQEEKVFVRINQVLRQIDAIINDETSFENFYEQVRKGNETDPFTKWMVNQTNPRAYAIDILPKLLEVPILRRMYSNVLKKMQVPLIQLSINYADSNRKFKAIEDASVLTEYSNHHEKILKIYDDFFGENRDSKIIEKITKNIDISEFGMLTLSNINILQEVLPEFINIKSRQEFEKTLNRTNTPENEEDTTEIVEKLSSLKRRELLKKRIFRKLLNQIMS